MSDTVTKGTKRSSSRPASAKAAARERKVANRRSQSSTSKGRANKVNKKATSTARKGAKATKTAKPKMKRAGKRTQAVRAKKPTLVQTTKTRSALSAEAAALRAFERAHREFARGRFAEARDLFRALIERHASVPEVTARARTYLAIAEARLHKDNNLPRDPDALYDRGVIELNRGRYSVAQEMFERALKRQPEAAHIHYGLAATRARLGSISSALEALERALNLQPSLRVRAQQDQDLAPLRNEPDFERLVFASR